MRSTKCLVAAALLAGMIGSARAETYSYTQSISGGSDDNNIFLNFSAQDFKSNRGILSGISFTVYGELTTTVFDSNRVPHTQSPLPLTFTAGVGIISDGFSVSQPGAYVANAGTLSGVGTDDMVQASGPISATFVIQDSAFPVYFTPHQYGYLDDSLVMAAIDHITGTDQFLSFDGQAYQFNGTIVQTFIYDRKPDHVPEPGSLALLGTAAVMLAGATRLTRCRPRS